MTQRGGVVYLAPEWPSPAHSGGRQRIAAIAAAIQSTGMPLTLLAPDADADWPEWTAAVRTMRSRRGSVALRTRDVAAALAGGEHVLLRRARAAGMGDAFRAIVQDVRPRFVILGRPFFGPFVDAARAAGSQVIADLDESLAAVARNALRSGGSSARGRALLELRSLQRFERREYPRLDEIWVSSSVERQKVLPFGPPVRIVPNVSPHRVADRGASTPGEILGIAYVGWYGYPPNERAAMSLMDDVLPIVADLGGPARLWLIGRGPTKRMARIARGLPNVEITGEVDDIGPYLRRAGLLVCPIRSGGGTRVKILEAMALGVPVVSTKLGVEGLELVPGRDAYVVDSPRGLAEAVVRLARDPDEVARVTAAAQRVIAERYSPQALRSAVQAAFAATGGTT